MQNKLHTLHIFMHTFYGNIIIDSLKKEKKTVKSEENKNHSSFVKGMQCPLLPCKCNKNQLVIHSQLKTDYFINTYLENDTRPEQYSKNYIM